MTASPTQTPSPTTVPDVLLYFAVAVAPASTSGTSLTVTFVSQQAGFLRSAASAYAGLLGVPASQVYATNVSDRATGAFVVLASVRRALQPAAPAAGSRGVAITFVVRLGKTPTQAAVANMSAVLADPARSAQALGQVAGLMCTATGLPPGSFAGSVAAAPTLANAPFSIAAPGGGGPTSSAGDGAGGASGGSVGGAAGGGVVAAILLAVGVWAWRSHAKHGVLPCFRDRLREKRAAWLRHAALDERASKADVLAKEVAELKRKLAEGGRAGNAGGDDDFGAVNPLGGASVSRVKFGPQGV